MTSSERTTSRADWKNPGMTNNIVIILELTSINLGANSSTYHEYFSTLMTYSSYEDSIVEASLYFTANNSAKLLNL